MNLNPLDNLLVADFFPQYTILANQLGAVNLAQGVPEPMMDKEINEALAVNLTSAWQYTSPHGVESLRTALVNEYTNEFAINNVLITSGCTESLYLAVAAARELYGNKIAFLEPFYPYYMALGQLLEVEAIPIGMLKEDRITTLDLPKIEEVLKSGTKIFLLNTPHNPSGWVLSKTEAIYLRKLADKYGVLLLIDEAYRYFIYDSNYSNDAVQILYKDNEHALLVGSASKLLSATGLRIGWMLGHDKIMKIAYAIHLYTTYCHPAPLQELVATILNNRKENWFDNIKTHYIHKRDKLYTALNNVGLNCELVIGGHFFLADYSELNNSMNPEQFAHYFAKEYGVMAMPCNIFYGKNTPTTQVRFSFSRPAELVDSAVLRLQNHKNNL